MTEATSQNSGNTRRSALIEALTGRIPKVRRPRFGFEKALPHRWFGNISLASHMSNGVNLLFPLGEKFFVRSVFHYVPQLKDPSLKQRVRGFAGQEGAHANAHERYFDNLRAQGYKIDRFLEIYEHIAYELIEPNTPHSLRLSVTVALEHFTAITAERALRDRFLDHAHPEMRKLMLWHAAEELEHKSVALDVLKAVEPGYGLRMAGMALGAFGLAVFWIAATGILLAQDRELGRPYVSPTDVERREGTVAKDAFWDGMIEYIRKDFHPDDIDNLWLAADLLKEMGYSDPLAEQGQTAVAAE